jgi:phage gp36-like protein
MAYASPDDMRARFREERLVQLADQAEWNDAAQARIAWALEQGSNTADSFVAKIYSASGATEVPPLLRDIVCDIALYRLYEEAPDQVRANYKDAMGLLEKISRGLIKLDGGEIDAIAARPGAVLVNDPGRVFSRDRLKGF